MRPSPLLTLLLALLAPPCAEAARSSLEDVDAALDLEEAEEAGAASASSAAASSRGSVLGLKEGDDIDGFRLERHVGSGPIGEGHPSLSVRDTPFGNSSAGLALLEERGGRAATLPFPASAAEFTKPHFLGAGSFGEAWEAKAPKGSGLPATVVVKVLYVEVKTGVNTYLTKQMYNQPGMEHYKSEALGAMTECNKAKELQKKALQMKEADNPAWPFASRLMQCFGHNIMKKTKSASPLYLVLENAGSKNLHDFIKKYKGKPDKLTSPLVASITRQLTEGLAFLAALKPPVIHHDFKGQNTVVKVNKGEVYVKLIDFGAMFTASKPPRRRRVVSTRVIAPPEYCNGIDYAYPAPSYDMFSLGNTIADMAIGKTFGMIWHPKDPNPAYNNANYGWKDYFSGKDIEVFHKRFAAEDEGYALEEMMKDPDCVDFTLKLWVRMVKKDATERPVPLEVLASPWLQKAHAPQDPEWTLYAAPEEAVEVDPEVQASAAAKDGEDGGSGCMPVCEECVPGIGQINELPKMICGIYVDTVSAMKPSPLTSGPYSKEDGPCSQKYKMKKFGKKSIFLWDCPYWGSASGAAAAKNAPKEPKEKKVKVVKK
mmetsp:Transcript_109430/g.309283  ORF Transcript_109430/g.309283 Transcript_109430/m.309283 type:complete len:599 (+) Transcript_109430:100-1896(+)